MRTLLIAVVGVLLFAGGARAQEFGAWYALGRFDADFAKNSTSAPLAPEKALKSLEAGGPGPDLTATYEGFAKQKLGWRKLGGEFERNALDVGVLDLNVHCPPAEARKGDLANAVCYLYRRIDSASELELNATLGSDDGVKVWFNGVVIDERHVARALVVQDDPVTLRLVPGVNHLFVKVSQNTGPFSFQIRPPAPRVPQTAINDAIDRGAAYLIREQLIDGSWGCWTHWGGGHPALIAYTLLKCGVRAEHPSVRLALGLTRHRAMDTVYAWSCLLLALEAQHGPDSADRMRETLAELIGAQDSIGLWDYPVYPGGDRPPIDMSNTLYAALALRAAKEAGLAVPDSLWAKAASGVLRCQSKAETVVLADGKKAPIAGFGYRIDDAATGSTTTAGLSVLAICMQYGGERIPAALRAKVADAQTLGLRWLAHKITWSTNPGQGVGHHYFWVYGLERVGALYDLERIGNVDWYWEGAEYLLKAQRADGSWNSQGYAHHEYLDTCLALLFLKKATRPTTGEETRRSDLFETKKAGAPVQLLARGDTPLMIWVANVSESVHGGAPNETLDVERVEYFARLASAADAEFKSIGSVAGTAVKPVELQRFALKHAFERGGEWLLRAQLHVRPKSELGADAARAQTNVYTSPDLAVRIDGALDAKRLAYAEDRGLNLLYGAKVRADASTQNGEDAPAASIDGDHGTRWRCDKSEQLPWLRLTLERPARADSLAISHALPRLAHAGAARVAKVDVLINQKERFEVELSDDVLRKTYLSFGGLLAVREIEIRVRECTARKPDVDVVGFSEVELFLRR